MLPHRPAVLSAVAALAALLASSLHASTAAQQASDSGATLVTVSGTVYDSLDARPLAGALVQLTPSDLHGLVWSDRTDLSGNFRIRSVPRGEYIVGFTHPVLDSLGLEVPPMKLGVAGSDSIQLALSVPSPLSVRSQLCNTTAPNDSSGLVLGFLRDADTGAHFDSGTVIIEWTELVVGEGGKEMHAERRSMSARATSAGWYALCGVPSAWPITARAKIGDDASGYIEIRVPPRGVLHRDFSIPRGATAVAVAAQGAGETDVAHLRHGSARLAGVVRDENGRPLAGAQLLVWGSGLTATSRDDGTFTISQLPAGTQTVEARYVGYSPERVTVELVSDSTMSVTVAMTQRVDVLKDVTVYGRDRELEHVLAGFNQRRELGFGHFITRADIEKKRPLRFTDLLRDTPGVKVVPTGGIDYAIVSSHPSAGGGDCPMPVYLDGVRFNPAGIDMIIDANEVAAIEIYAGISETPPQFGRSECGSVVIWTVPNLPRIGAQR
ncbi:MAG TPA: carboxypeptidase regulatory-like domain-containing protein [Gemmatimonadaceae bacterium]